MSRLLFFSLLLLFTTTSLAQDPLASRTALSLSAQLNLNVSAATFYISSSVIDFYTGGDLVVVASLSPQTRALCSKFVYQ